MTYHQSIREDITILPVFKVAILTWFFNALQFAHSITGAKPEFTHWALLKFSFCRFVSKHLFRFRTCPKIIQSTDYVYIQSNLINPNTLVHKKFLRSTIKRLSLGRDPVKSVGFYPESVQCCLYKGNCYQPGFEPGSSHTSLSPHPPSLPKRLPKSPHPRTSISPKVVKPRSACITHGHVKALGVWNNLSELYTKNIS